MSWVFECNSTDANVHFHGIMTRFDPNHCLLFLSMLRSSCCSSWSCVRSSSARTSSASGRDQPTQGMIGVRWLERVGECALMMTRHHVRVCVARIQDRDARRELHLGPLKSASNTHSERLVRLSQNPHLGWG